MRRARIETARAVAAVTAVLLFIVQAPPAHAQEEKGFALGRFVPSERGSSWFALDSLDLRGQTRPAIGLVGDWAHKPLVIRNADDSERAAVVEQQAIVHAGGSLVVGDRFRFALSLPMVTYQTGAAGQLNGTTLQSPGSAVIGDLRTSADVRIFGNYGGPFTTAAGLEMYAPTGSPSGYIGDGAFRAIPRVLVAGSVGPFVYAGRVGVHLRGAGRYAGSDIGTEFVMGAAAGVRPHARVVVGPEVFGSTVLNGSRDQGPFRTRNTPLEALLGAHVDITRDLHAGLGFGTGITRGFGSPQLRGLLSVEWAPRAEPTAPAGNRDNDAVASKSNPEILAAAADRDGDGVPDDLDQCVDVPGVASEDREKHGCPLPPDRDHDEIGDAADACPDAAGPSDPDPTKNGCPRAVLAGDLIRIRDAVKFQFDSAELDPASDLVLASVKRVLEEHAEIQRIRIEGHTDSVGVDAYNLSLSEGRAASVRKWFVAHGIAPARVESKGFGSAQPLTTNETEEGRQHNRRVEFHVVGASTPLRATNTNAGASTFAVRTR
jgi:OmpA-OmpF porin, OOP family